MEVFKILLPAPIPPNSPLLATLWTSLLVGLPILSFLAQREGTRSIRLGLGGMVMGHAWRLSGGLDVDASNVLWNYPYGMTIVSLLTLIPRLSLPSQPYTHTNLSLNTTAKTFDRLLNPTLLDWNPTFWFTPPTRRGPLKSAREHAWAFLRDLGLMMGLMGGCAWAWRRVWEEKYERGEWEMGVELGGGLVGVTMVYLIIETGVHGAAAMSIAMGQDGRAFPELMDRPWKSASAHEYWSHRWHPAAGCNWLFYSYPFPKLIRPITIFLSSGLFHEFGLFTTLPLLPRNPTRDFRSVHVFTGFFLLQAVPMILETLYKRISGGKMVGGWFGRAWLWVWFFGGLRWVIRGARDSGFARFGEVSTTIFRTITPEVLIASKPFSRFGFIPIGGRSTFLLLPSKDLFIVVSTPLDKHTRDAVLDFAGEGWESRVSYLLAPNTGHVEYIKEWKQAFPSARLIVPKSAEIPDAEHSIDSVPPTLSKHVDPYIKIQPFSQSKNHDLVVFHLSSQTLIEADLLFNLPGQEQYSKSRADWFGSLIARSLRIDGWFHKILISRSAGSEERAIQTGLDATVVSRWDFTRIIPCHGDVIEIDGEKAWKKAYGKLIAHANPKMGW